MKNSKGWIFPITGAVVITSGFGQRTNPITKKVEGHNGVDIAAVKGHSIVAPAAGIVEAVLNNNLGGMQIIIRHADGYKTGYAHLSAQLVKQGQAVTLGEEIGKVGSTGMSTGPHLHFTVTDPAGVKIDPEEFFKS